MSSLPIFGMNPVLERLLLFVVSVLTVAFGTYIGVVVALQSFFGAPS